MVEICRAVLHGAKVLVLYEASEGYTSREWETLRSLLIQIRDEGISVIFIHSDLNKVLKIADRVQVIARGFARTEFWPEDYTDEILKILYQSEQFYSMHKTLEQEQDRADGSQVPVLRVNVNVAGVPEPVNLEIAGGMTTGIVAMDGQASELAQILGRRIKGEGQFCYGSREYSGRAWKRRSSREVMYVNSQFWKRYLFYNLTIGENMVLRAYPRFHRAFWLDKRMVQFAIREYCGIYDLDETMMEQKPQDAGDELLKEIFWIRLAIAPPKLLVMEEPFYALDEVGRLYMHKYTKLLKEKGCAIVICGKNHGEIKRFCDKTYSLI